MVSSLAEQLTITVAPAMQWRMLGGQGTHTSSQTSAPIIRPGAFLQENRRLAPMGTVPPSHAASTGISFPGQKWRAS